MRPLAASCCYIMIKLGELEMNKWIKLAFWGIFIELIIAIPALILDHFRMTNKYLFTLYIFVHIIVLLSNVLSNWGYKIVGDIFKNKLLKNSSLVCIFCVIIWYFYFFVSLVFPILKQSYDSYVYLELAGIVGLMQGIGMLKLRYEFKIGKTAKNAGFWLILASVFTISIFLSIFGALFLITADIFGLILLYKTSKIKITNIAIPS